MNYSVSVSNHTNKWKLMADDLISRNRPVSQSEWGRGPRSLPTRNEPWRQEVCFQNCYWEILDTDSNRRTAVHRLHQVLSPKPYFPWYTVFFTKRTNNEFWLFFRSADSHFELEWRDGRVCIRAANGKYVTAKKNGQLAATIDNTGQSKFWYLSNATKAVSE